MSGKLVIKKSDLFQYDPVALLAGLKRRRMNIAVFRDVISKEREQIKYQQYIISQIDPDHFDVKILEGNIKKRRINIKTFQRAIINEKVSILKEKEMIKIIKEAKGKKD